MLQVGRDPDAPWVTSRGPRQGHLAGFDLHANLAVRADDHAGLVRLCRYVLRPPVAQTRLQRLPDGRVLLTLKGEWSDGTTHVLFEPIELLERLAVLVPRPRINVVIYHGILAPHAAGRRAAVNCVGESPRTRADPARGPVAPDTGAVPNSARDAAPVPSTSLAPAVPGVSARPRYWTWAHLMRLVFDLDVLACPRCGGRMVLLATIEDPRVVARILGHLGLPTDVPQPRPARSPPAARNLFGDASE